MTVKLFGSRIEPACCYCKLGKKSGDGEMVLCSRRGIVEPHSNCRSFRYAPLKRVPTKNLILPKYSKDDFSID